MSVEKLEEERDALRAEVRALDLELERLVDVIGRISRIADEVLECAEREDEDS